MAFDKKQHRLGMVLSGGGAKGAAHIGVLTALEEQGVKPTCVAGTSAGALAGAFYACGFSSREVLELMVDSETFNLGTSLAWSKPGMLDPKKFLKVLCSHFKDVTFESLDVELQIVATDIVRGTLKVFSSGPILEPLLASCAFPFIFSPVEIDDSLYSDGGIINNFPTKVVVGKAKHTLGVYVSPLRRMTKQQLTSSLDVADRAYRITNRYASLNKLKDCTWVINPIELEDYGTFTISKVREIYDVGYKYGSELAPTIKDKLEHST